MTKPQRDWTKIKYYPVSIEKLQNATMREAAYLIAPVNIGEDYEYFDKVKHFLIIPEEPKGIEYYQKELDEKIDALIKTTKEKFEYSKVVAEKRYKYEFDKIFEKFEYAKDKGHFPLKLKITYGTGLGAGSYVENSFVIKQGNKHEGYYTIGNQRYFRYYMPDKPNFVSRFFMRTCLGFVWFDEKDT